MQRYNNPWVFSFKDVIAGMFIIFFFYLGFKSIYDEQALAVLQVFVTPIMVILGCYFAQEALTQYQGISKSEEPPI